MLHVVMFTIIILTHRIFFGLQQLLVVQKQEAQPL